MERNKLPTLSTQMKRHSVKSKSTVQNKKDYDGNTELMISTGSTLLDLAISGGRIHGGGLPGGIFVEIFGPSGSGKTVLLSEIAGAVQRKHGKVMFHDPEARLNKQFAQIFNLDTEEINYQTTNTVTELFQSIRDWAPATESKRKIIHGIFADSLAALSTTLEMEKDEGDKMGMRRAKEFSQELRRTARELTERNLLMICSNQVRVNHDAGPYGQKYSAPGGEAIGFYASLRLRTMKPEKIKDKKTIAGKEVTRVCGINIEVEVFKNSVWKPYRTAPVTVLFDYGIDDIRQNLQFIKNYTKNSTYTIGGEKLDISITKSIEMVEQSGREKELKEEVINLWEEIESKFEQPRKPKQR